MKMRKTVDSYEGIAVPKAIMECAKVLKPLNIAQRLIAVKSLADQVQLDLAIARELEAQKVRPVPVDISAAEIAPGPEVAVAAE